MDKTKESSTAQFSISGSTRLSVKNGPEGPVQFNFIAVEGWVPTCGEVLGDNDLLDAAWHAGRVTLAMANIEFRVKVIGRSNTNGALIVESAPLFRALVASVKTAARSVAA